MLQIRNLTITHLKDLKTIIKDFSFVLNKGDKVAIIGEEGNGKSTLLKLIYDSSLIDGYAEYEGEIIKKNTKIGYLCQEISELDKNKTVYEFISEASYFYDLDIKELSHIATSLNINVETFYSNQKLESLSGGEKVKIQLARILIDKPNVLLLDEPSNDIDIVTLIWLEKFINSCEIPVIFVSHDEILLSNTANVIIHIERIKRKTVPRHVIAKMRYQEYINKRMCKLQHQEQAAKKEKSEFDKQKDKLTKIMQKVDNHQDSITRRDPHGAKMLKKKMHTIKAIEKRFEKEYENMTKIPNVEEAIFIKFSQKANIPNGKHVISFSRKELMVENRILAHNIKLDVIGPEKVCIVGKNGVGKTTLIKEILKEINTRKDIKVAYMPQNYEELLDYSATPIQFLTKTGDKEENSRICTYLGSLRFTLDEMYHNINELSGGQKAKLIFLKLTMGDYNVLILDEPTRNFSPLSTPVLCKILKDYSGVIISISHDRKYINEIFDTIYELDESGLKKIEN